MAAAERFAAAVDPRIALGVLASLLVTMVVGLILRTLKRRKPAVSGGEPRPEVAALRKRVARMARRGRPVHLISRATGVAQDAVRTLLDAA
jgi:hypothetical protein